MSFSPIGQPGETLSSGGVDSRLREHDTFRMYVSAVIPA